ncbi:MAG TPA: hypothetical protein VNZ06_08425 [Steroidobacteraceae bacterium]|jgi:hypothetical protein|nr:hypothetical protein [Steroidobacteraceae bacterium]
MSPLLSAYFFSGSMKHETAKRILAPIARRFMTGEPADTIDRLFSSKHVNDLRLILAVAFTAVAWIVFFAGLTALIDFADVMHKAHDGALDESIDLLKTAGGDLIKISAPVIGIFGAVLAWAYQVGSNRLGVVDLFACEIDTLCRVCTVTNLVDRQISHYAQIPGTGSVADGEEPANREFSSAENYFPILDSNAPDLQSLEARVVINITAFYTFMKSMRDSLRRLPDVRGESAWHESMSNIIYMLYLALESARHAITDLVEFEPQQAERTMVILLSELTAYRFLRLQYMDRTDVHNDRLILRGPEYRSLVPELCRLVRSHARGVLDQGNKDQQWAAALQLLPELEKRYDALRQLPLGCGRNPDDTITAI